MFIERKELARQVFRGLPNARWRKNFSMDRALREEFQGTQKATLRNSIRILPRVKNLQSTYAQGSVVPSIRNFRHVKRIIHRSTKSNFWGHSKLLDSKILKLWTPSSFLDFVNPDGARRAGSPPSSAATGHAPSRMLSFFRRRRKCPLLFAGAASCASCPTLYVIFFSLIFYSVSFLYFIDFIVIIFFSARRGERWIPLRSHELFAIKKVDD